MQITWFSWKDSNHPAAGGAERVSDEIRKRLVQDGHKVTLITARYPGSQDEEVVNGIRVLRSGSRYSVYLRAKAQFRTLPPQDVVIDEMNTIPFLASLYRGKATPVLLTYQLARSVWFYQMSFPLSLLGYLIEPLYLRVVARSYRLVLTESESTKEDLQHFGFKASSINVFRVGLDTPHATSLPEKKKTNQILFLGAFRPMKRPLDAVKAFEIARTKNPKLTLVMAGNANSKYGARVLKYIEQSPHRVAITVRGRISEQEKTALLRESSAIIVTSVKEGWGLIVTEANSQGTPAIVYNADGLRDSVRNNETGLTVPNGNIHALAERITQTLRDPKRLEQLRMQAFSHSKQFTHEQSYKDFVRSLKTIVPLRSKDQSHET